MISVLLVGGSPDLRTIYATLLEHHGYTTRQAASLEEALRSALAQPPNVVIVDADLPEGDAGQLLARLTAEARLAGLRVVVLVNRGESPAYARYGVTELVKPVLPRALLDSLGGIGAPEDRQSSA